ncbi:DUF4760 domain-containing protein [Janthinobacterium sp. 1_2014MBL_MicDiv]|uniref:DUF4760 domain-containing protein n=1 Tax=Janthinobacterium sp. 1_2014MBL_MicDiv TaxID=1644131 RepID=UPI0008F4938A|nr:DUF4760 domain-containing protein [Janthinobacterium sp. 1_2014MBL_MicDiv]APA66623.1 hypothetical protein YQ44_00985 [Janthinobacterium sp. 1_2014MBL_MicDiv]
MLGLFAFWDRFFLWLFSPRRLLLLMLIMLLLCFGVFVAFDRGSFDNYPALKALKPGMAKENWLIALGILAAATGWIVSSIVTIRNSVKQHTINTLLQTRLSVTYMKQAEHVNDFLIGQGYSSTKPAPITLVTGTPANLVAVDYILNFLEFLAVGIRHGDLHEKVLKDSMRGIVVGLAKTVEEYLDDCRGVKNGKAAHPRVYENLIWLRDRWDH